MQWDDSMCEFVLKVTYLEINGDRCSTIEVFTDRIEKGRFVIPKGFSEMSFTKDKTTLIGLTEDLPTAITNLVTDRVGNVL